MKKIAIFCGGPSSEHEVSLNSARNIFHFLDKKRYEVYYFYISKDTKCKLLIANENINFDYIKPTTSLIEGLKDIKEKKLFALLAGIHGEFVEDGRLQTFLEFHRIPYSGSNSTSSALCMDKYRSTLLAKNIKDILLPKTVFLTASDEIPRNFNYPCIVKPNALGSSVGLFIAHSQKHLEEAVLFIRSEFSQADILVQELIEGIELSCGVLQKKEGSFINVPPIEIRPKKSDTFDYASKYEVGGSEEITPPPSLTTKQSEKISHLTAQIHELLGCSVYSRSDFRIRGEGIYFLETNTLPGMTATSLLPQEAQAAGISFTQLLDFIIENS